MSDYQSVTVKTINPNVVTIEVVEDSHDSRALASIFDQCAARDIDEGKKLAKKQDWLAHTPAFAFLGRARRTTGFSEAGYQPVLSRRKSLMKEIKVFSIRRFTKAMVWL